MVAVGVLSHVGTQLAAVDTTGIKQGYFPALLPPPNDGQRMVTWRDLCPDVEFEPIEHVYHVGGKQCISVTQLIEKFFEPFDADQVIDKYMARWQADPKSPYYGKTRDEIKEQWDGAAEQGTWMHSQIENYFRNEAPTLDELREEDPIVYRQFCDFRKNVDLDAIYGIELRLGLEGLIAGTVDLVTLNLRTDKLTLYDWKRTKGPAISRTAPHYNKYGLLPPFAGMRDTKFMRYSVQLNFYRYMLERLSGKEVEAMYIVQFHPDLRNYNLVKADFLDFTLEDVIDSVECSGVEKK